MTIKRLGKHEHASNNKTGLLECSELLNPNPGENS